MEPVRHVQRVAAVALAVALATLASGCKEDEEDTFPLIPVRTPPSATVAADPPASEPIMATEPEPSDPAAPTSTNRAAHGNRLWPFLKTDPRSPI